MENTHSIHYPLFLVPLEAGYVSVVDASEPAEQDDAAGVDEDAPATYYLAVFTSAELSQFIHGRVWHRG